MTGQEDGKIIFDRTTTMNNLPLLSAPHGNGCRLLWRTFRIVGWW